MDPAESARRVPRSELGGSARAGRRHAREDSRRARRRARWPASARRKARTRRRTCSRSSCARASASNNVDHCTRLCHASSVAALLEGIGSGAVSNPVMDVMKADVVLADRRQSGRQPSGRGDVDQERGQARHEADPCRPAALGARAPRGALPAVQARHRRRAAQRDDAHHRRGRARRRGFVADRTSGYEEIKKNVAGLQPGSDGAGVRHSGGDDPRGRAPVRDVEAAR